MPERHLPVRPHLDQLRTQAKELLPVLRSENPDARLSDAQRALARSYGVPSWPRLVLACRFTDAVWRGDLDTVRALVEQRPSLLRETARGTTEPDNWGRPLSYAANVGQNDIVRYLRERGADDVQYAFERACLRGKCDTARLLHSWGATVPPGAALGPCESLNADGLALMHELGGPLADAHGDPRPLVGMVLQTYSRHPEGKRRCLELLDRHAVRLTDTPAMAAHRGRTDLLDAHLRRDPSLLSRPFSHAELFPVEMGCDPDPTCALHGTPLDGGTLLHLCVDNDDLETAAWLLERGAPVDGRAAVDAEGFGGHTPLFGCVVSQARRCGRSALPMARLLLERGADPTVRASLRKALRFVDDESLHAYPNVTPREWGERFHDQDWVDRDVLGLLP